MKTAVEWFYDKVIQKIYRDIDCSLEDLLEQAKEIEKKQKADTWNNAINAVEKDKWESFEHYYNETFKQQEQ
jgi:hypothetical protein